MRKNNYTIILFYRFTNIKNPEKFKLQQRKIAESFNLKGSMLIAKEGVNATFEGTGKDIKDYIKYQKSQKRVFSAKGGLVSGWKDVTFKDSAGNGKGFTKLMIKVRPEAVTLSAGEFNVKRDTAPVITAAQLEKMYKKNEDFVVLDLRNDFEVKAGYFEKTVNLELKNFRDLPQKINELAHLKNKKVVAVCTGGIRCEKAACLLKREGFKNLCQLKDGIHAYIKKYPAKRFKGSLFVFDNRMTTPIVEGQKREIVGRCFYCAEKCEQFYNDDSTRPSKKIICCGACIITRKNRLRPCAPA